MNLLKYRILVAFLVVWSAVSAAAQTIRDELRSDVRRVAGRSYALTLTDTPQDTPPPAGKHPYYINHFGCPTAYYLDRPSYYNDPFKTLSRADSLGKLTELGRDVLRRVALLRSDSQNRTGELTASGRQQARDLARQMVKRLPEMFTDSTYIDGRSIVQNHCLLTLGETVVELSRAHHPMRLNSEASHHFQRWLNPQDQKLDHQRTDSLAMVRYAEFTTRWAPDNTRLMAALFSDADYAKRIDAAALGRQLFDLACFSQYEEMNGGTSLYDLFTPEELHRHWLRRNAWAYIRYGGCTLNGGHQPYTQRSSLWNLLHISDSITRLDYPVVHLRYTHESVVMSLICLMELDDYGLQTDCLDSLETLGWADYRIAPLGGGLMMVHYRTDKNDPDPLVRVLLNNREARLPIPTDCAPYYHWKDVKRYYLRKLYSYVKLEK